jgi:hypothetical protein
MKGSQQFTEFKDRYRFNGQVEQSGPVASWACYVSAFYSLTSLTFGLLVVRLYHHLRHYPFRRSALVSPYRPLRILTGRPRSIGTYLY